MKKIVSVLLALLMLMPCCMMNASAYQFPSAFWKYSDAYVQAVESNDYDAIIHYGQQLIDVMRNEPTDAKEVVSVLADKYQMLADIYSKKGMYEESVEYYKKFMPFGEKMDWADSLIIAKSRIDQYTTTVGLYTDGGSAPYFGAKNEPQNGVLFGLTADSKTRSLVPNESAILMYHELGYQPVYDTEINLQYAAENGLTVEFALNCPGEGTDIRNFESKKYDIENISNILKKYPTVPILLRFGAEMNIWPDLAEPSQFKEAFRYVSQYFKQHNPNVAMVWSPGSVSNWGMDMNNYYPGDEYVDWVGVSLYINKYFMGNPDVPTYEEEFFKTGINADPILLMKEVIEKYGERKPIMISESGQGAIIRSSYVSEDATDWAIQKMKEFYHYLPMVYPQIKFVAYFDTYVNGEVNNYCLATNPRMQNQYISLVNSPRLIKKQNSNATMCYQPIYDNISVDSILPVSCYAHVYNDSVASVSYYIDDTLRASASEMPYTSYISLSDVSDGAHTLKAVITTVGGKIIEKTHVVNVVPRHDITVIVDGKTVSFDQPPVLHNGRTMVPLRAIFEAINATVDWYANTQTAIGKKGNDTVHISIGSDMLLKNGKVKYLDVPAMLPGGRTLVPARAIAESFDCDVKWDGTTKTVTITTK